MALTPKQQRFVDEYLVDLNGTQAAIRAGYSKHTAQEIASENLSKPMIQEAIAEKRLDLQRRTEITQERVLREYAKLAFFDPRKFFNGDGSIKKITDLDDESAGAVAGIDVVAIGNSDVGIGDVMKIKLADKKGSLDSIARHLGMFNDKMNHGADDALTALIAQIMGTSLQPVAGGDDDD